MKKVYFLVLSFSCLFTGITFATSSKKSYNLTARSDQGASPEDGEALSAGKLKTTPRPPSFRGVSKSYTFLLIGETRDGKSTFVRSLCGLDAYRCAIGTNNFKSTTRQACSYTSTARTQRDEQIKVTIIDTPGFSSTNLETDPELFEKIKLALLEDQSSFSLTTKIDAILVTESMTMDRLQWPLNRNRLLTAFARNGLEKNLLNSVIILGTKPGLARSRGQYEDHFMALREEKSSVPFLDYETMSSFSEQRIAHNPRDFSRLLELVDRPIITPFIPQELKKLEQEFLQEAKLLMRETPKEQVPYCTTFTQRTYKKKRVEERVPKISNNLEPVSLPYQEIESVPVYNCLGWHIGNRGKIIKKEKKVFLNTAKVGYRTQFRTELIEGPNKTVEKKGLIPVPHDLQKFLKIVKEKRAEELRRRLTSP